MKDRSQFFLINFYRLPPDLCCSSHFYWENDGRSSRSRDQADLITNKVERRWLAFQFRIRFNFINHSTKHWKIKRFVCSFANLISKQTNRQHRVWIIVTSNVSTNCSVYWFLIWSSTAQLKFKWFSPYIAAKLKNNFNYNFQVFVGET